MVLRVQGNVQFGPTSVPFTLPQSSSVLFHIDPSDATTMTLTGSSIDQIDDLSGNGRDFVDNGVKPIYVIAGQNGLNTMDFAPSASNRLLLSTDSITIKHLFVVAKYNLTAFTNNPGLFTTSSSQNIIILTGGASQTWISNFDISNYFTNLDSAPTGITSTLDSWTVHSISDSTGITDTAWIVGHDRQFGTRKWDGQISEIVGYDAVLGSTDRDQLITDLKSKWGIA